MGNWGRVLGELLTFSDHESRLPVIDLLEGSTLVDVAYTAASYSRFRLAEFGFQLGFLRERSWPLAHSSLSVERAGPGKDQYSFPHACE